MSIEPGTYAFGPQNAELLVHTRRTGAAAKAGHDLEIEVTSWSGTLEVGAEPGGTTVALSADGRSLRVRSGTGGVSGLGDEEKASIQQSIDDDVLKGSAIEFRCSEVRAGADGDRLEVEGELELFGRGRPISFELSVDGDGRLRGDAILKQSEWGIKPFSILFGTLKVADEVRVTIAGELGAGESRSG
jgi:polyisoprenoid-binding protein YceI